MTREGAVFFWNLKIKGIEREPFVLPKNVCHYYKGLYDRNWQVWTWEQEFEKRRKRQEAELSFKRRPNKPVKKAALIHVFYNDTNLFGGWWIYIITLNKSYAINFRHEHDPELVLEIMKTFHCGIIPMEENFYAWCEQFSKLYPTKSFGGRPKQGVLKCWVEIYDNKKIKLLGI